MNDIILNLMKRMKNGLKYKKSIRQTYSKCVDDNSNLIVGAKIKYYAQSTFHTVDQ